VAGHSKDRQGEHNVLHTGPPRERTPLRDTLESFAVAVLLVLLVRQVVVEAFRIRGGSMAPTLISDHMEMRCPNCSYVFDVGEGKTDAGQVECPNCGFRWYGVPRGGDAALAALEAANRQVRGPARVFINKFVYQFRKPRRWEIVVFLVRGVQCVQCGWRGELASDHPAFCPNCDSNEFEIIGATCPRCSWFGIRPADEPDRCPACGGTGLRQEGGRNFIKRVVGLPGEKVELFDGDVHVDGHVVRKPPAVQEQVWIPVFDSRYVPRKEIQPAWEREDEEAWEGPDESGGMTVDALRRQRAAMISYGPAIRDFYAYDGPAAARSSGNHRVGDCRIRARVRALDDRAGGAVVLAIADAGHEFMLRVGIGEGARTALVQDGETVGEAPGGLARGASGALALENYDDRVVASIAGRAVLSHEYEPAASYRSGSAADRARLHPHSLRLGAAGARVRVERVRIDRDLHYIKGDGTFSLGDGPWLLADDEYFVMGDNSPLSSDSRSRRWLRPGVSESHLVGRAFLVFWPVHAMKRLGSGLPEGGGDP